MCASQKPARTVGIFEVVSFPAFEPAQAIAKLDTGAYSGAIHCSSIVEKQADNGPVLEFYPLNQKTPVQLEDFAVRYVKSSNAERQKRYFIETYIILAGRKYEIVLSLTDRSQMKWQVLIGRRFLKQHGFIIDVRKPSKYRKA